MSKIPYYFETPIPSYFRKNGWFKKEKTWKFVSWAFSKCSYEVRKIVHDGHELILQPFEFIAGRKTSSVECFLTEKEFRGQLICMESEGILKKTANSKANRFTCYIWVTDRFIENKGQQSGQQRANSGPTEGHNLDKRSINSYNGSIEERDALNEKIIPIEENIEAKLIYKTRRGSGVDSIPLKSLNHQLKEKGYFLSEIEYATEIFKQKQRTVGGDIIAYFETMIINERQKHKGRQYESKSKSNDDSVQRSKKEFASSAGVYAPRGKGEIS